MTRTIVRRFNKNVKPLIEKMCDLGRDYNLLAAAALLKTNADARAFFKDNGGDIFFDKSGMTTRYAFARYCGVSESYVQGIMARCSLSTKSTPSDVMRRSLSQEYFTFNKEPYRVIYDDFGIGFSNRNRNQVIRAGKTGKQILISPRVALFLCFMMKYGRTIPVNSPVMLIYEYALHSPYYEKAMEIKKNGLGFVEDVADGVITQEQVSQMIAKALEEFAVAYNIDLNTKKESPKTWSRRKAERPAGWDEMVDEYRAGKTNLSRIAERTGLSSQTIRRRMKMYPAW